MICLLRAFCASSKLLKASHLSILDLLASRKLGTSPVSIGHPSRLDASLQCLQLAVCCSHRFMSSSRLKGEGGSGTSLLESNRAEASHGLRINATGLLLPHKTSLKHVSHALESHCRHAPMLRSDSPHRSERDS